MLLIVLRFHLVLDNIGARKAARFSLNVCLHVRLRTKLCWGERGWSSEDLNFDEDWPVCLFK